MPLTTVVYRPGVDSVSTSFLNEKGWSESNQIRFFNGYLQKNGGCQRLTNTPVIGTARGMHAFEDLAGNFYIGVGTNQRLYIYNNGALTDVTPVVATSNLSAALSTIAGFSYVIVTDSQAVNVGDVVYIANATYIGGIFLQGDYVVTEVASGAYTIQTNTVATSTVTGGGQTYVFTAPTSGNVVTLTMPGYTGFYNYETIQVYVSTSLSGMTLQGNYLVSGSGSSVTFVATGASSGPLTVSENSGQVMVIYGLSSAIDNINVGYGMGPYGGGPYGGSLTQYNTLRQWSIDNWGQDMIASYTGGPPYLWTPPITIDNPAVLITPANVASNYVPWTSNGLFVAMPEQQLVIYGTDATLVATQSDALQDPMLIRFSDVSDYTTWYPTVTNQAGSFRLPSGSRIVTGQQSGLQALIITDIEAWLMTYIGFPLVYGFQKIGVGCGAISNRSLAKQGANKFWMSQNGFFMFDGSNVNALPCTVWDQIFPVLDRNFLDNVFCATNSYFSEVAWFYPTVGSNGVVTNYVKFHTTGNLWDYGELTRTDWIDQSAIGAPVAVDGYGLLQQHETSNNLDNAPMESFALSGWFALAEGSPFVSIQRFFPDFILSEGASMLVTIYVADYVNAPVTTYGPYTVTADTQYAIVKARGRVARIKVESTGLNVFWRLGKMTLEIAPAGSR